MAGGFTVDSPKDFAARIYASMLGVPAATGGGSSGAAQEVEAEVV